MFLLPRLGRPNLRWVTDLAFDSQLFHQVQKPLHRSSGFDPHTHRAWKRGIKLSYVVAFVRQGSFPRPPPLWCPASPPFVVARVNQPIILIPASFGPSNGSKVTSQC